MKLIEITSGRGKMPDGIMLSHGFYMEQKKAGNHDAWWVRRLMDDKDVATVLINEDPLLDKSKRPAPFRQERRAAWAFKDLTQPNSLAEFTFVDISDAFNFAKLKTWVIGQLTFSRLLPPA